MEIRRAADGGAGEGEEDSFTSTLITPELNVSYGANYLFRFPCRHQKNKKDASELLAKLKDNRELQSFLQDGQEVKGPGIA